MTPGSQADRLVRFLREHPGSTSLEITYALQLVNVTGRVSDARADGYVIECRAVEDAAGRKRQRYYLVEAAQQTLGLTA